MAGNQYQDGKPEFIMKCQAGNNSDGPDTRGLIEIQTKNPTTSATSSGLQESSVCSTSGHHSSSWSSLQILPELRLSCKVPLQISPSLRSMFKSRASGQPAGPDDVPFGKVTLPKTPLAVPTPATAGEEITLETRWAIARTGLQPQTEEVSGKRYLGSAA